MNAALFAVFQVVSVLLFVFLSAALLYHHRLGRWLVFALCYFMVYVLAGSLFFGRMPGYFPDDLASLARYWLQVGSVLLLLFGFVAVIGCSLLAGHSPRQHLGAALVFLAGMGMLMSVVDLTVGYGALGLGSGGGPLSTLASLWKH